MEEIINYLEYGVIGQIHKVKHHHSIRQKIANNISELNKLDNNSKKLFIYIQHSAQVNTVVELSKLFDRPNARYPTRCILGFLILINDSSKRINFKEINLKYLDLKLKNKKYSPDFIELIKNNKHENFVSLFYDFYSTKYKSNKLLIEQILNVRDKYIVHNEMVFESVSYKTEIIDNLCDFAEEVYSTFNILFGFNYVLPPTDTHFIDVLFEKYNVIQKKHTN